MRLWVGIPALLVAAGSWFGTGAYSAELTVTSRPDAVTVFPRGAEVLRLATVRTQAGAHTIVLPDLPIQAVQGSIRVAGKSSGDLKIGSVDSRRIYVMHNDDTATGSERRRLETDIERLGDELAAIKAVIATKATQQQFVENLAALPTRPQAPPGAPGAPNDWVALFDLIGGRLADVRSAILDKTIQLRGVERRLGDLKKKLALLAPRQVQRTEVRINIAAGQALTAELAVSYQVREASWQPLYDARLQTGSRNVPAKLELTRRAAIRQQTDEAWSDVAIALSTTRPRGRTGVPVLAPLTVDIAKPLPPPAPAVAMERYDKAAEQRKRSHNVRSAKPAGRLMAVRDATETDAVVQSSAFQVMFKVPGRISIGNAGDVVKVKISDESLEPALVVRAVPKRDQQAYLYAKIKLPRSAPYLAGPVALFRDQTFVGQGRLPQLAPGETHELGFGADDLVRVKYEVTGEKRGETGLISSSRTDLRQFKIIIKNLHERPIAYGILD
ncbi:MAG TPA: mucoidy inhibitor MuiA family protein, partial [Hyphomicrobiaceae bacterium]|nr:mucoidy inhibitor MuiA family protein [Hyphomicrobiaceae bacterium]